MNEPQITPELVASHGLKPDEYERILKLIGRVPSFTELGIFSAMWNEHCSYKSSKVHLRYFGETTTDGARLQNAMIAAPSSCAPWSDAKDAAIKAALFAIFARFQVTGVDALVDLIDQPTRSLR